MYTFPIFHPQLLSIVDMIISVEFELNILAGRRELGCISDKVRPNMTAKLLNFPENQKNENNAHNYVIPDAQHNFDNGARLIYDQQSCHNHFPCHY